ncbi:MAG: DUF1700 domain-containing protein [Clostridium sp.]|nr:DUF1700 domain-containing protein [Clostridium sp.]
MDRQEFMQDLRESLEGEISPSAVQDNLRYYNNYFDEQKAAGRSDEEILEELGEARLIARTILQSVEAGVDASPEGYDSDPSDNGGRDGGYRHDYTQAEQSPGRDSYSGAESRGPERYAGREGAGGPEIHYIDFSKWYVRAGVMAVFVLVLVLIFALMGGIFALLIRYAGPILLFLLIYAFVRRL